MDNGEYDYGKRAQDDPRPVHSARGSTRNEDFLTISQAVRTDSVQACSFHVGSPPTNKGVEYADFGDDKLPHHSAAGVHFVVAL
jgi:hypothetical protein